MDAFAGLSGCLRGALTVLTILAVLGLGLRSGIFRAALGWVLGLGIHRNVLSGGLHPAAAPVFSGRLLRGLHILVILGRCLGLDRLVVLGGHLGLAAVRDLAVCILGLAVPTGLLLPVVPAALTGLGCGGRNLVNRFGRFLRKDRERGRSCNQCQGCQDCENFFHLHKPPFHSMVLQNLLPGIPELPGGQDQHRGETLNEN